MLAGALAAGGSIEELMGAVYQVCEDDSSGTDPEDLGIMPTQTLKKAWVKMYQTTLSKCAMRVKLSYRQAENLLGRDIVKLPGYSVHRKCQRPRAS